MPRNEHQSNFFAFASHTHYVLLYACVYAKALSDEQISCQSNILFINLEWCPFLRNSILLFKIKKLLISHLRSFCISLLNLETTSDSNSSIIEIISIMYYCEKKHRLTNWKYSIFRKLLERPTFRFIKKWVWWYSFDKTDHVLFIKIGKFVGMHQQRYWQATTSNHFICLIKFPWNFITWKKLMPYYVTWGLIIKKLHFCLVAF